MADPVKFGTEECDAVIAFLKVLGQKAIPLIKQNGISVADLSLVLDAEIQAAASAAFSKLKQLPDEIKDLDLSEDVHLAQEALALIFALGQALKA